MEDIKEKIKDPEYRNWVKCTLGLEQTKTGVHKYVFQKFHMYIQGNVSFPVDKLLTSSEAQHMEGTEYIRHSLRVSVKYTGRKWIWDSTKANCPDCEVAFNKILFLHTKGPGFKDIWWENSNDTTKISLEWALAKMFMPQGNEQNTCPGDTDPAALFHMMLMCKLFQSRPSAKKMALLKDVRNELFHSSTNTVSDDVSKDHLELMAAFLQEAADDKNMDQSITDEISKSVEKIKELQKSDITMTVIENAADALQIKRRALYYDFEETLCQNDPEKLRKILELAEQLGGDIQLLKKHIHDLRNIDRLKAENEHMRNQRDKMQAELKSTAVTMQSMKSMCKEVSEKTKEECTEYEKAFGRFKDEMKEKMNEVSILERQEKQEMEHQRQEMQQLKEQNEKLQVGTKKVIQMVQTCGQDFKQKEAEIRSELTNTGTRIKQQCECILLKYTEDIHTMNRYKAEKETVQNKLQTVCREIKSITQNQNRLKKSFEELRNKTHEDLRVASEQINDTCDKVMKMHCETAHKLEMNKLEAKKLMKQMDAVRDITINISRTLSSIREIHSELKQKQIIMENFRDTMKQTSRLIYDRCHATSRQASRLMQVANDVFMGSNELHELSQELLSTTSEAGRSMDETVEWRSAVRIPLPVTDRLMILVVLVAIIMAVLIKIFALFG